MQTKQPRTPAPTPSMILSAKIPPPADTVVAFSNTTIICTCAIKISRVPFIQSAVFPLNANF